MKSRENLLIVTQYPKYMNKLVYFFPEIYSSSFASEKQVENFGNA